MLRGRWRRARDLNARRFVFANAAARELLRIQRPEGPLTTAIRAPEVLAAVDEALFEQVDRRRPLRGRRRPGPRLARARPSRCEGDGRRRGWP